MLRFLYIVYGVAVLAVSTTSNLKYAGASSGTSSGWNYHSSGVSWGGSGGSTGGFSSGGSHK